MADEDGQSMRSVLHRAAAWNAGRMGSRHQTGVLPHLRRCTAQAELSQPDPGIAGQSTRREYERRSQ